MLKDPLSSATVLVLFIERGFSMDISLILVKMAGQWLPDGRSIARKR